MTSLGELWTQGSVEKIMATESVEEFWINMMMQFLMVLREQAILSEYENIQK